MESEALYIEQDGDQFNDLWLACAVIFGVLLGFFLGVAILFVIRKNFPAKYTKADAQRLAESGLQAEEYEEPTKPQDPDTYSEIVPPGVGPEMTVLSPAYKKPLSWVRRHSTVDLGQEGVEEGVIDALAQDTCAQMHMALLSQEFRTIVSWEEELQNQYRQIFLNLINIYLDSLIQQKILEPEHKKQIADNFSRDLKEKEREWNDTISAATQEYERNTGDPLQSHQIEDMRYQFSKDIETTMLETREQLRTFLVENTKLKDEELEFMEEKLVENLTMMCEIVNGEYVSLSMNQSGRFEVIKKAGGLNFANFTYESEEMEYLIEKFKVLMSDLKSNYKLGGSAISKLQKTFEDRVRASHAKFSEEYDMKLQEQLEKAAKDRVGQMRKIKSWKRSTDIASTANQSYQAAVDGLIEPSRYIQTVHELQQTVRLDKMLACKRIDVKEGELFESLVRERVDGKKKEYISILSDAIGALKLEKGMDTAMLDTKSKSFQQAVAQHRAERVGELEAEQVQEMEQNEEMKRRLKKEISRQSADQEELLGEQEDAVKEVLQTQSGLTEMDREHMMAIHQHQALAVINMLFMNRLRAMKRVEMGRLQNDNELREMEKAKEAEISSSIGATAGKALSKKQTKLKLNIEQKYAAEQDEKKKEMTLTGEQAVDELRQLIYKITTRTLEDFDERGGMLLARLHVSHARKEGTKVKMTQVLNKIKTKLVDIIWNDGYISEASCKKTLQDHHKMVQEVGDKFAVKRDNNIEQIEKVSTEKRQKRETQLDEDISGLIEEYKKKEHTKIGLTEPLWKNWANSKRQIETHNTSMELSRQVQDLYNSVEDQFAEALQEEEMNIILELVKMSRMDPNQFDSIIKSSVAACVGGEKLYKELSAPLLEKHGQVVKRTDKTMSFWQSANEGMAPPKDPKLQAERAADVWRARLGIYDDKRR